MKPGTDGFLGRAAQALAKAGALLDSGATGAAAARPYYAMVYAAKALLNEEGLRPRSHARLIEELDRRRASPGALDARLLGCLAAAAERRRVPEPGEELSYEEAERLVAEAREFVAAAERRLGRAR
jgi:uncharacterized protein (UPF0332 family)